MALGTRGPGKVALNPDKAVWEVNLALREIGLGVQPLGSPWGASVVISPADCRLKTVSASYFFLPTSVATLC